jgi:hypothetical protein
VGSGLPDVSCAWGVGGGYDGVGDEGVGLEGSGELCGGGADGEGGGVDLELRSGEGEFGRGRDGDSGGVEADGVSVGVFDEDGGGGLVEGDALTGGGVDDELLVAFGDGVAAAWKRGEWGHLGGFSFGRTLVGRYGLVNGR